MRKRGSNMTDKKRKISDDHKGVVKFSDMIVIETQSKDELRDQMESVMVQMKEVNEEMNEAYESDISDEELEIRMEVYSKELDRLTNEAGILVLSTVIVGNPGFLISRKVK